MFGARSCREVKAAQILNIVSRVRAAFRPRLKYQFILADDNDGINNRQRKTNRLQRHLHNQPRRRSSARRVRHRHHHRLARARQVAARRAKVQSLRVIQIAVLVQEQEVNRRARRITVQAGAARRFKCQSRHRRRAQSYRRRRPAQSRRRRVLISARSRKMRRQCRGRGVGVFVVGDNRRRVCRDLPRKRRQSCAAVCQFAKLRRQTLRAQNRNIKTPRRITARNRNAPRDGSYARVKNKTPARERNNNRRRVGKIQSHRRRRAHAQRRTFRNFNNDNRLRRRSHTRRRYHAIRKRAAANDRILITAVAAACRHRGNIQRMRVSRQTRNVGNRRQRRGEQNRKLRQNMLREIIVVFRRH